jgi:hypothetical protein
MQRAAARQITPCHPLSLYPLRPMHAEQRVCCITLSQLSYIALSASVQWYPSVTTLSIITIHLSSTAERYFSPPPIFFGENLMVL